MRSFVARTLSGLAATAAVLSVAAAPAAAGPPTFRLTAGGVVAHGIYERVVSVPERPVPPILVAGSLAGRGRARCAVIQVARSGPADGIEWQTFGRHCGTGRSGFRVQTSYLFRGVQPPVRLCAGRTVSQAERARVCDVYRPATVR